jgi:hypothetical protein
MQYITRIFLSSHRSLVTFTEIFFLWKKSTTLNSGVRLSHMNIFYHVISLSLFCFLRHYLELNIEISHQ